MNMSADPTAQDVDAQLRSVIPSNADIQAEKNLTRRAVLAATQRILLGQPKHVPPGSTSITHLAVEAQIGRHHLYTSLADLRNRFEYLRDRAVEQTPEEHKLQSALDRAKAEIVRLRDLQKRTRQDANDWRALTELLARGITTLQEALHQEQMKSERLVRRFRKLEERSGEAPSNVLMHRRKGTNPIG